MSPEERERLNRMERVGLLAAGVSHDFNNTAFCVLAELSSVEVRLRELRRLIVDKLGPDAGTGMRILDACQRSLETIDASVQASVTSNREVQRLYRCESQPVNPLGADLRRASRRALQLLGGRLRPVAELRDGDPIRVAVSEDVVVRVLLNLLINAADAFPAEASQPRVQIRISAQATGAICDVIDNGPGVVPDLLPRLFQPFATTKSPGSGTGLGLAVSRDLLRAAGGELVLLESGSGSTVFRMTMPISRATPTPGDTPAGEAHLIATALVGSKKEMRAETSRALDDGANRSHAPSQR
jgi:two-component system NtrC family sensor kinase